METQKQFFLTLIPTGVFTDKSNFDGEQFRLKHLVNSPDMLKIWSYIVDVCITVGSD